MALQIMILAGFFVAISNYFMRKSIDAGGTTCGFLTMQLLLVTCVSILLGPVRSSDFSWHFCMIGFGIGCGIVLSTMLQVLGKALTLGPPGITFAILNASAVMPSLIMSIFFGHTFGYVYSWIDALSSLLVLVGLFLASQGKGSFAKNWATFAIGAFFLHTLFLVSLNWRALFINYPGAEGLFLSFDMDQAKSAWFMPSVFITAFLIQVFVFATVEKRALKAKEISSGIFGGVANGIGTFLMIFATEKATSFEHTILYPLFSISVIVLCNLWGMWFYKERVRWLPNVLAMAGIVLGTMGK